MALATTLMDARATIERPRTSRDKADGTVLSKPGGGVILKKDLPCSVQQAGISVQLLYSQRNQTVDTTIYFYTDPGTSVSDQITVTDRVGNVRVYLSQGEAQPVGRGRLWNVAAQFIGQPA